MKKFKVGNKIILIDTSRTTELFNDAKIGDTGTVTEVNDDGTFRVSLDKSSNKIGWWYQDGMVKLQEVKQNG
jgi:ribosomal protein L21E